MRSKCVRSLSVRLGKSVILNLKVELARFARNETFPRDFQTDCILHLHYVIVAR